MFQGFSVIVSATVGLHFTFPVLLAELKKKGHEQSRLVHEASLVVTRRRILEEQGAPLLKGEFLFEVLRVVTPELRTGRKSGARETDHPRGPVIERG
jgi:hypothetical protein